MNAVVVVSHDPAAGQNWRERTHIRPRSRQMPARGSVHFFAFIANKSKSPGRSSAIFDYAGELLFARCWAVGGAVTANHLTPAAIKFVGAVYRPLRSLFSDALLQACKQSCSRVADRFHVLSCALFVHDKQRIRKGMSWVTSVMLRVARCL